MSSIIFIFILTNVTATPTASPSETAKPTTSPTAVPISTPNNSYYTDDDSLSDYVTPPRTVYDTFHYLHCKKVPLTINGTGTLNIISTNGGALNGIIYLYRQKIH